MSDKAEHLISKYLNEKMEISFGSLTVYDHITVKKLVDFSIEQHLKDVLGEMEKRLDEMTTDGETGLDWICGYQEALNLLKQRKG